MGHPHLIPFIVEHFVRAELNAFLAILAQFIGDAGLHPCNYRRFASKNQFQKEKMVEYSRENRIAEAIDFAWPKAVS